MATDRDLALRYLGGCLNGAILGQAGAVRPSDLVRSLPRGMRLSVALLRQVLPDDPRFEQLAGRFDIASRAAIKSRPFGGAVEALLADYGRPMPTALMVNALARIRGGSPEYFTDLLDRYAASRTDVIYLADHVVDAEWILSLDEDDEQRVLFFNRLDRDEDLQQMRAQCDALDLRRRDPGLTAATILAQLARPIGPRQLAFLVWQRHPQIFDPVGFVAHMLERDGVTPACGMWLGEATIEALHEELQEASDEVEGESSEADRVNLGAILADRAPATAFKLRPQDEAAILSIVRESQVPIGVDELVVDVLEIAPNGRRFPGAVHALDELLSGEPDLIRRCPGRYLSSHAIPDWVHSVPEPLLPVKTGANEDVLISLDALPEQLRAAVLDPVYEDVASGVRFEPSGEERDLAEYPLLHHHFVMGTMAIRTIDRPFFASEPPLSLVVMRYGDAEAYPVWLNTKIGLLFGLSRWYHRHLPPSGAVFRIRHGEAAESYVLDYDGEVDTALAPADARIAVLERKRERVAHRPIATRDLMLELLDEHDAGLSFNALWAEMNAVRRTSRWQIASLLAYHACFSESDGRWMGDRALMGEPGDPTLAEAIVEA